MHEENLIKNEDLTPTERRLRAIKAGQASGEARRKRKELKDELLLLLGNGDAQTRLCTALLERALKGDVRAFETVRDTIGQKPVDRVAQTTSDGKDIPVNDLSKVPTATLLQMAERAGVNVDADEK